MADRLTIKEKHKVQQQLLTDTTIEAIATDIGKSEYCINKYFEEELIPLKDKIEVIKAAVETEDSDEIDVFLTDEIKEEAINLLVAARVPQGAARKFIETEIEPNLTGKVNDATALYKVCIPKLAIHTSMIQQTEGGNPGVTIATQASSQIAEEAAKKAPTITGPQSHIFRPKG